MDNEELGRLLLMREELKQTGAMRNHPQKPKYGSIRFSPHYMQLYQHFYPEQPDFSAVAHPPTPPATNSQSRIISRATLKGINPSHAPSRAPSGDSADSDWTPPPHVIPSSSRKFPKSWISISDHSDVEGKSEDENVKPRYGPPVLFIFWVKVIDCPPDPLIILINYDRTIHTLPSLSLFRRKTDVSPYPISRSNLGLAASRPPTN